MRDSEKFLARLNLGIGRHFKVACSVLMHEVFAFLYFQKASKNTPAALVCLLWCSFSAWWQWDLYGSAGGRRVQIVHIYFKIAYFFSPLEIFFLKFLSELLGFIPITLLVLEQADALGNGLQRQPRTSHELCAMRYLCRCSFPCCTDS